MFSVKNVTFPSHSQFEIYFHLPIDGQVWRNFTKGQQRKIELFCKSMNNAVHSRSFSAVIRHDWHKTNMFKKNFKDHGFMTYSRMIEIVFLISILSVALWVIRIYYMKLQFLYVRSYSACFLCLLRCYYARIIPFLVMSGF